MHMYLLISFSCLFNASKNLVQPRMCWTTAVVPLARLNHRPPELRFCLLHAPKLDFVACLHHSNNLAFLHRVSKELSEPRQKQSGDSH